MWYNRLVILSLSVIFFALGLIIGSFLNVVIYRYNTNTSLGGRSACMSCQKKLCWYELIPLISFLTLRGRCHSCKSKIDIQYPIVEFLSGLVFMFIFLKFQYLFFIAPYIFFITFTYYALAFSILLVIAVYDFKHKIIPDMLVFIFGALAFFGMFFFSSSDFYFHTPTLLEFLAGPIAAFPFLLIWWLSKGVAMGLGDAKLVLGLGWLLGLTRVASGLTLAFWLGAIIGIILLIFSKKYGIKSEIPFAPFLILGTLVAFMLNLELLIIFN
ncbi:prepilin peptidase [Candidatus Nomurabacteria bacterium]|nr:prepilin peptidase [Candidatus Nomurabacteria bacterium]